MSTETPITQVTDVFGEISGWLVGNIPDITALFYSNGELTFLGTMSLAALGVGITLLLVNVVKNFVKFR